VKAEDLKFAESTLDAFIESSINRVAESGVMRYTYKITAADMKDETGRSRLHDSVIGDYTQYFEEHGVYATYKPAADAFTVVLDLDSCVLRAGQARFLSSAMEKYRTEND
jgi:hypothetical protein